MLRLAAALTIGRLLAAVPAAALLGRRGRGARDLGAALFLAASVSDYLDGYVARRYGTPPGFGTVLDPLADKALVDACLVALARRRAASRALVATLVARDVAVTLLRAGVDAPLTPSPLAKLKTVLLYAGTFGLAARPIASGPPRRLAVALLATGVALSLVSALDYTRRARRYNTTAADAG